MSDSAVPRPRPRPKPRLAKANAQPPSTISVGSSTSAQSPLVINDTDDLFVINRGRTKETWKRLEEVNKVTPRDVSDNEVDGDCGDKPTSPSRKRAKKRITPNKWQKAQETLRMLSVDLSDDSDSEIEMLKDLNTQDKRKVDSSPQKRKRQKDCSKSSSITPPPEIPAAVLLNARNVIRQALEKPQRAPSPIIIDDPEESTDTIVLDPDLARIANDVSSQSVGGPSVPKPFSESETLAVTVRWQKHPLNTAEMEPKLTYQISRDESFRELFESTAEDAQILTESLVISYRNRRIFPSTTPAALGIWGEVEFVGCHQVTWEYLRKQALEFHQNPIQEKLVHDDNVIDIPDDDSDHDNPKYPANTTSQVNQVSDGESEPEGGRFKLVLRSNKHPKDITLIVKHTTKCGAIVRTFVRKAGLADQYPHLFAEGGTAPKAKKGRGTKVQVLPDPCLSVDGDKMENGVEIGEADLDDGDMVEVVGL